MSTTRRELIIWIVTYWTDDPLVEPVVTPFINEESARICYEKFKETRKHVCIDRCKVFSIFEEREKT